jgi:hypothetical protein
VRTVSVPLAVRRRMRNSCVTVPTGTAIRRIVGIARGGGQRNAPYQTSARGLPANQPRHSVVDTVGIVGYYTMLAMVLNTTRTPAPANGAPPLPTTK